MQVHFTINYPKDKVVIMNLLQIAEKCMRWNDF